MGLASILSLLLLGWYACGETFVYQEKVVLPEEGWTYPDSVTFSFPISDTISIYDLVLEVEHHPDFAWQNMYVKIHTDFPGGKRLSEKVSLQLMDPEKATWYGKCRGDRCKVELSLQRNTYFQETGEYTLTLQQFMRTSPLEGVHSIGLAIQKVNPEPGVE